jgi:hypothetical protein
MKFSIRDLLLVTVIVALAVGWWLDRARIAPREEHWRREAADLEEELPKSGRVCRRQVSRGTWSRPAEVSEAVM